ncbi:MAG: Do family serine endopeptidase [Alphaproteobacteria bacterium]|jgi:serine protease Do|nr:Do family serine endopeptidase [Alphaproteobacteria bacterium]
MAIQQTDNRPFKATILALFLGAAMVLAQIVPAAAQDRPTSFAELAETVSPAVVNITTSTMVAGNTGPQGIVPEGSPFEDFFNDFNDGQPRRSSALGSGFVISEDGFIVTNNHVIEGADEILIEFFPGGDEMLEAELVGTDPNTDIALLKVEADRPLSYVSFGDSDGDTAEVGDWVMAMGNPLGQGFSVSAGIVSARNRELAGTYDDYIQTDAAINRGNSGGPLFDMNGDVIGVNTAILSPNGGSIGIGFAMSSAVVTNVVEQLKEFGETRRGWLGVRIQDVTPDMIGAIDGLDEPRGAMVTDVPDGPARDGGVEAGDIILTFDGVDVADTRELVTVVGNSPVGKTVDVAVLRDGETVELAVKLGRRETAAAAAFPQDEPEMNGPASTNMLGMTLSEITEDMADELGVAAGQGLVITEIEADSEAAAKGLLAGDVITEANQSKVTSIDEFEARVEEAQDAGRKSILMLIRRGGEPRFVALSLE